MTAARIGESKVAVDALMMNVPRNRYLLKGYNGLHHGLPVYLTRNGSLLVAVSMMAVSLDGGPDRNDSGFPEDGTWAVRSGNLRPLP